MKILFFGDIVAKIGRQAMAKALPELKEKYQPDIILANIENLAHGKGVTAKTLLEMKNLGIHGFTSGNHVWKKEEVTEAIESAQVLLATPANDPRTLPQNRAVKIKGGDKELLVVNLLGRVFMDEPDLDCPFKTLDAILAAQNYPGPVLVDFHAEATSEKMALGWYADGRISALMGTHTHIPTSDWKILPKGTAYVTDVGMVGPIDSVIGVKKELIIEKFLTDSPIVFDYPETGLVEVNAVLVEIDESTKRAVNIQKINQPINI